MTAVTMYLTIAAPAGQSTSHNIEAEEYAVYSVLIDTLRSGATEKALLIRDHTATAASFRLVETDQVSPELLRDFQLKNERAYLLGKQFNLAGHYQLISEAEDRDIFQSPIPIITLSRVGFNAMHDEALVQITFHKDSTNKREYNVVLIKDRQPWRVTRKLAVIVP